MSEDHMKRKLQRDRVFAPVEFSKVFKDPIHGDIVVHPLLVTIIDTPQFQRLRCIRQLGPLEFVYPGAVHTRFQHCVGTCYLAGLFIRKLCENDPDLLVEARDVLCVQIAALLHDLGHGPYSHLFDGRFLPQVLPDFHLHHEDMSIRMFEHLLAANEHVRKAFSNHQLTERDELFIKELIYPKKYENASSSSGETDWPFKGRSKDQAFLYEIVSNKLTGVDVDKFDYLARDALHLGMQCTFDHMRYITFSKVVPDEDGVPHIVARDKEAVNLYDLYQQRYRLHLTAYQHKTALVIQEMFTEVLLKANDYFLIPSAQKDEEGRPKLLKMSECVNDMSAYEKLTDDIFSAIRISSDPNLDDAKRVLDDIYCRRIFACVGRTRLKLAENIQRNACDNMRSEVVQYFEAAREEVNAEADEAIINADESQKKQLLERKKQILALEPLLESDIVVCPSMMNYGINAEKNPLDKMRFYSKCNPTAAFKMSREQISVALPSSFSERLLFIYAKRRDSLGRDLAARCFRLWCKLEPKNFEVDEAREGYVQLFTTPVKQISNLNTSLPVSSATKKQKLDFFM